MKPEDVPKLCTWNEEEQEWRCNKCHSVIMGKEQIVSLHTPPSSGMPLVGFGETTKRIVPYCPNCEEEPSDTGVAYYGSDEDPDVEDMKIIKKMGKILVKKELPISASNKEISELLSWEC